MILSAQGWEAIYTGAVSMGCGVWLAPEDERLAATDELLAEAIPGLVRLGSLIAAHALSPDHGAWTPTLQRQLAGVVRLLDRALAAHGRDNGYAVTAWRASAATNAWAFAEDEPPLLELVEDAATDVARAFVGVPRDRLGVPDHLALAIGYLLCAYAMHTNDCGDEQADSRRGIGSGRGVLGGHVARHPAAP
jgi:hypothetical protein